MDKTTYNRKRKRLDWLQDREAQFGTNIYDNDIELLSNEIEAYENKEFNMPVLPPNALIAFHIDRLGISDIDMAEHLGIGIRFLKKILKGDKQVINKFRDYIYGFDFQSIKQKYNTCIIRDCNHIVRPMFEVDNGVGISSSNETPICEDCYNSENPFIIKQIEDAKKGIDGLPF